MILSGMSVVIQCGQRAIMIFAAAKFVTPCDEHSYWERLESRLNREYI